MARELTNELTEPEISKDLPSALTVEKGRIWKRATAFSVGVVTLSTSTSLVGILPCLYSMTDDDVVWCLGAWTVNMLRTDPTFLRETTKFLLGTFVVMILAVVIMRPRVSVEDAPLEAARGTLTTLAFATGLVTSVFGVHWSAASCVQWSDSSDIDEIHVMEMPLGILAVAFCALSVSVLQSSLGVAASNLRWAERRVHALTRWERDIRATQSRRADLTTALSALALMVSLAATHTYWNSFLQTATHTFAFYSSIGISVVAFVVFFMWSVHLDPDRRTYSVSRSVLGAAVIFYQIAAMSYAIPLWAAAMASFTGIWFFMSLSAVIAMASYDIDMPKSLSLKESVENELLRCRKIIDDNNRILALDDGQGPVGQARSLPRG